MFLKLFFPDHMKITEVLRWLLNNFSASCSKNVICWATDAEDDYKDVGGTVFIPKISSAEQSME
jgi:hypothetical protein